MSLNWIKMDDLLTLAAVGLGGYWFYSALTTVLGRPEKLIRDADAMDYDDPYITGDNETFGDYWELLLKNREEAKRVLMGNTLEVQYLDNGLCLVRFKNYMNKWFRIGYDMVDTIKSAQNDFSFTINYNGGFERPMPEAVF